MDVLRHANAHDTLGHLYLLADDLCKARAHAQESGRLAKLAGVKRTIQLHEALLGLSDRREVRCGREGVGRSGKLLAFAKRVDHTDVADYLGMCADAHEAAGLHADRALMYLQQLVDWKRKALEAEVIPPEYAGAGEASQIRSGLHSAFDATLLARSQRLQVGVQQRIQHLVETAINAEVASGHDLYRTFRLAKLSRCLAAARGPGRGTDRSAHVGRAAVQPRHDGYTCTSPAKETRIVRR